MRRRSPLVSPRQRLIAAGAQRLSDYAARARATNLTDIRGALTQAAQYLASRPVEQRSILLFSDMEEDCRRTAGAMRRCPASCAA
jgi:hypothetical protein